jgi:hypothetical protein
MRVSIGLLRVAAPIGSGHLHQLEGVADLADGGHMRAPAQIDPIALCIHLQCLVFRDSVDQFDLERLAFFLEKAASPCRGSIPPW